MNQDNNIQWAIGAADFCYSCQKFYNDPENREFIKHTGLCASCDHLQSDNEEDYGTED